jgi:alkanesulfonate monooxygenase SsuD/methylene tetrahydromethanopterin reductase-like flavin-dependent oxidoreductase (luciferase family)
LAAHAAARAGGSERVVRRRRSVVRRLIVVALSAALARELAERILAYVRCAQMSGRVVRPVSALLAGAR